MHHGPQRPSCQGQSQSRAHYADGSRFGEELGSHAPPSRAQCRAHRQFPLARRRIGQDQVGDVAAGNQQHARSRAKQDQQRRAQAAGHFLIQRHQVDAAFATAMHFFLRQPPSEGGHFGARRRQCHARLQAADRPSRSRPQMQTGHYRDGLKYLRLFVDGRSYQTKVRRQNAYDRVAITVDDGGLPQHRRTAPEAPTPEGIAQNHDAVLAGHQIRWGERTPARRRHAQRSEEAGRDERRRDAFRLSGRREIGQPGPVVCEVLERCAQLAPAIQVARGGQLLVPRGHRAQVGMRVQIDRPNLYQTVRFGVG